VFSGAHGPESAKAAVLRRSGRSLDPDVVRAFASVAGRGAIWERLKVGDPWPTILAIEPGSQPRELDVDALDDVALALADFADLKTPHTAAHSRTTSELAAAVAKRLGLPAEEMALVRRAGLVHDVGQVGLSARVLTKKEPLNQLEEAQLGLHPELSERILSTAPVFRSVAAIVGMHHERLDGQGYPRGLSGAQLPRAARILAAVDSYLEQTQGGSGHAALDRDKAVAEIRSQRGHSLDGDCVDALLAEIGAGSGSRRPRESTELSEREVEVLRLAAKELTIKEIGKLLFVSPHTVRHHLEHIHKKIGASSRAGAVLYAMEKGLLDGG
jgi:HD-GYP domain-containing protein (c-di-GMP phosphodiesterase class II)